MKPYVVGFIFARGGSKGVPRKNIRLLGGKPLIAHAIEIARSSKWIDRVIVSTDSFEIAQVAQTWGAEVPFMRPAELAHDDSPEWLAWQHAIHTMQSEPNARLMDVFVSIPTTSPLRITQDVDVCIEKLLSGDADIVITVRPADRNPYFNMVTLDEVGNARLAATLPSGQLARRQDAPVMYDITTVAYAARPNFVQSARSYFEGRVQAVTIPSERAIDIDTEHDFKIAEAILASRTINQVPK
jgi:N-acylneuraminate cytidylyltransferase